MREDLGVIIQDNLLRCERRYSKMNLDLHIHMYYNARNTLKSSEYPNHPNILKGL